MKEGGCRAVVFDLDGTLLDSYAGIREALNPVLLHYDKDPVTLDQTRFMVGEGLPRLIEKAVGPEAVEAGVRLFRDRYRETALSGSALIHDAEEVMAELARRGIPMSIASNKPALFSRQILESLGIAARFAFVGGPDIGFAPKPDPAMAMPIDVQTARASGMPVAALPTGSSTRDELVASGPDVILDNLCEILPLFRQAAP